MATVVVSEKSIGELKKNIPPVLYKYRSWENDFHKSLLIKQELHFSSPYDFEDDKDCRFPIDFNWSYDRYEEIAIAAYKKSNGVKCLNDIQLKSVIKFKYEEEFSNPALREQKKHRFYELFNSTIGIYCLCEESNNFAMWNKYAEELDGFCVGIDFQSCLHELMNNSIGGGNVTYLPEEHPPFQYISGNLSNSDERLSFYIQILHTKYKSWEFEKEYRLHKFIPQGYQGIISSDQRKFTVPKNSFKEIIFGEYMPSHHVEEIKSICSQQKLNVSFKKAYKKDDSIIIA